MEVAANAARTTHRSSPLEPASKAALTELLEAICVAAEDAVVATESELGVLHEAQIVDAGAVGMLIILDELRGALQGHLIDPDEYAQFHGYDIQDPHIHQGVANGSGVEVMCTINLDASGGGHAAWTARCLGRLGDHEPGESHQRGIPLAGPRPRARAEDALQAIRGVGSPVNVSITDLCTHDG